MEKEIEKIILNAPKKMQEMLSSVYNYNIKFVKSREAKKLLEKILFYMSVVDRQFFVEDEEDAYSDNALPIGEGQTISQPSTVARMLMLAELKENEEVLEVGAGSGWNASLISFIVYPGNVFSIDRVNSLVEKAEDNISKLRNFFKQKKPYEIEKMNVNFSAKNLFKLSSKRKFDKIIITAGIPNEESEEKIRKLADSLLKKDGILVCPYAVGPMLVFKNGEKLEKEETKEKYLFVPLLPGLK